MVGKDDIEKRVIELVTLQSGSYMFRRKKFDAYNAESNIHFDVKLDQDDVEEMMDKYFPEFQVKKERFNIHHYFPEVKAALNPFKKQIVDIPEFTISMLIESAKAGRWLYD
ncbi:acyl carrier protein [Pantoea rodasii]|uniref:Acyl carrier protein n=1 Tax=Pantoea rodasii TaxID=1076549 RepID=A0A0B1R4T5_9GAMM|nr:DUF1493 family protein [Pantoea rodasii]KHJ66656.1 acyl carrier protein [Pantoea rodasii]